MQIYKKANLKPYHTFAIDVTCEFLVIVESIDELKFVFSNPEWSAFNKLMLGKGSNLLFTEHYNGVVIVNRILGKTVDEDEHFWRLHINGGEDWPNLVAWSVENGYLGLENLALIPGCAGSAPIQNIGAYGVEFKDICDYVDIMSLSDFTVTRLSNEECIFSYRDSVFKNQLYGQVVIVAVGLKLSKQWQAVTNYGNLKSIPAPQLTAKRVFDEVCQVRMSKLPDPAVTGNAGSFFKNPMISQQMYQDLKLKFPDIVAYPTDGAVKLAAGWLIDQCKLKGHQIGGAQVHPNQALVLVNRDNASALDIVRLAAFVRTKVFEKYQVELEHEVRFMNSTGETTLTQLV